jgi:hypothetical protein
MIDKKRKTRIYSQYEIKVINFYATMIWLLPIILVVTYVFEIDQKLNINQFIFWLAIANFILTLIGTGVLLFQRDLLKRRVKADYQNEFVYLLFICSFGVLGLVVIYDYMGGNRQYIANVLVVVVAVLIYILLNLNRKFFKYDYMKKK